MSEENGLPQQSRTNPSSQVRGKARVTLSDIAKAASVSRATVSLVLRDSPSIPQRTKEHVLRHAG
nr:MAG: hypothetical protein DIU68_20610 [Chloroflexota bacterium]